WRRLRSPFQERDSLTEQFLTLVFLLFLLFARGLHCDSAGIVVDTNQRCVGGKRYQRSQRPAPISQFRVCETGIEGCFGVMGFFLLELDEILGGFLPLAVKHVIPAKFESCLCVN